MNHSNDAQRIVRIRPATKSVCALLDYTAKRKKIELYTYYSNVFEEALNSLAIRGFHYYIEPIKSRREPKGFPINNSTSDEIDKSYNFFKPIYEQRYNRKFYMADFIEILLYVFIKNNFGADTLNDFEFDFIVSDNIAD